MKNQLIIVRGTPGSGKSTLARRMLREGLVDAHYEADMFHIDPKGSYNFKVENSHLAHKWCKDMVKKALEKGLRVAVSNTFLVFGQIKPYIEVANELKVNWKIIQAEGNFQNVHNVPSDVLDRMSKAMVPYGKLIQQIKKVYRCDKLKEA